MKKGKILFTFVKLEGRFLFRAVQTPALTISVIKKLFLKNLHHKEIVLIIFLYIFFCGFENISVFWHVLEYTFC